MRVSGSVLCALAVFGNLGCRQVTRIGEPEGAQIETTLLLIGDAGEPNPRVGEPALDSMAAQASVAPNRTIVVFLGDNVYPEGIPEEGRAESADARRRLASQVNAVPRGARGIFIPGNHDWANTGPFGLYAIRQQERVIASLAQGRNVRLSPQNGCPGPVSLDVGRLRLITLDTQWWLHSYIVKDSLTNCLTNPAAVTDSLRSQVAAKQDGRITIVAGHHPLMTGGEHGGYCGITGPFRRFGNRSQDITSGLNRSMRDSIESAFSANPPLAYAAGHEHNLQVLRGGPTVRYLLVSGAGSSTKTTCAVWMRESYHVVQQRSGFMRLDIMRGKGALLRVFHYAGDGTGGQSYSRWLELP